MNIKKAELSDFATVKAITHDTIKVIYPHYYPAGAVEFFLDHHSDENITSDIKAGLVFLLWNEQTAVGTVTIKENEINRLFILPKYQHSGFGHKLLIFAEEMISKEYEEILLAASFPAKAIYIKRGYSEIESHSISTANGDFLCYDMMKKNCVPHHHKINYDGRIFVPKINTENGEVDGQTNFFYHQKGNILWSDYAGGEVMKGYLIGTVDEDGSLDFTYQHINKNMEVRIGKCHSIPVVLDNGKLELHETWQWLNGDKSAGSSIIMEQ